MKIQKAFVIALVVFFPFITNAQKMEPWISYPSASVSDYGVYHFRKNVWFDKVPEKLIIHISADNRYNFFINEERVCYGPAKGDLQTYKYDVINIAPYLQKGKNQFVATVYNGGKDKALALQSVQTAFLIRTENEEFAQINTDESWKVLKNPAYKPVSYNEMIFNDRWFYGFYACGPGDNMDANTHPWDWKSTNFDDSNWKNAEALAFDGEAPWNLVPRNIAFMDNHLEFPAQIRKIEGLELPVGNWDGKTKLTIPSNTSAKILIDFELFTMGYPELKVVGGKESRIQIKYAEALYEKVNLKAHRDSVDSLIMFGVWDVFHPDGARDRTFRPLWKRAFRYVQFVIETKDQPLEILSYVNEYSGYPYPEMSTFKSNNSRLNEIFKMSLQTFRMCSGETYYDTPFYEQLSYGGDNRPISAISVYNSTDDRLFREMMRLYPQSENKETGLFKSAYPSRFDFDMGSWSMAWIQSLHDYYFMRGDIGFVKPFVENIEGVLGFYQRHLDERSGLIGTVRNKNFIDWSIVKGSLPRADENKEMKQSTLLTLYFAHTLDCAVKLYNEMGETGKAKKWRAVSNGVKVAIYANCWDKEKQLFKDYPDKEIYSQHSNIMAILCDVVPLAKQKELINRILSYEHFDEMASSYFSFFLFKALQKTGQEDLFLKNLDFWYNFIDRGHTTCGETGFASHDRSDCHAWSAHPSYFLLSTVCGIKPADIGFNKVKIIPHPGDLNSIKASMPHPKGRISVDYKISKSRMNVTVFLPDDLQGEFEYNRKNFKLVQGVNHIKLTL